MVPWVGLELEEVQGVQQELVRLQGGPRSLPLLATAPGAEAEVEGLRLPCVWGEELPTLRLPEAGAEREQAKAATFSVVAAFELHLNV